MELNKSPSPEKSSDLAPTTATHDEQKSDPTTATAADEQCSSPSQTQARTYECNFCKRGFSNAQALGGHMNIHRKDKAKLKQATVAITEISTPPPPHQQFSEISKTVLISQSSNLFTPISTNAVVHDQETRRGATANWNWSFSSSDITSMPSNQLGLVGEPRQLPLFKETSSKTEDHSEKDLNSSSSSSSHGADDDHELDLELRLGHEPSSDSSKGTRKFF